MPHPLQGIPMGLPAATDLLQQRQQPITQQGLTTGEPHSVGTELGGNPDQAQLLLQGHQPWWISGIGAAVRAGQIAAGGQGKPQHPERSRPLISNRCYGHHDDNAARSSGQLALTNVEDGSETAWCGTRCNHSSQRYRPACTCSRSAGWNGGPAGTTASRG